MTAGLASATATTPRWAIGRRIWPSCQGGSAGSPKRSRRSGSGSDRIEPEMISHRSRLFTEHADSGRWSSGAASHRGSQPARSRHVPPRGRRLPVRHSLRPAGRRPISYVKWDMNRNITEPYGGALPVERQGEFFHRYILGVYDLYERLGRAFPNVLFESCASGGGRFDPGMLAYAPQTWTSDDTNAIERLRIQWGTSLVYPLSSMAAHVSAVPNHQVGRITPLQTRAAVAFFGVLRLRPTPRTSAPKSVRWSRARVGACESPPGAFPARAFRAAPRPVRGRRQRGPPG